MKIFLTAGFVIVMLISSLPYSNVMCATDKEKDDSLSNYKLNSGNDASLHYELSQYKKDPHCSFVSINPIMFDLMMSIDDIEEKKAKDNPAYHNWGVDSLNTSKDLKGVEMIQVVTCHDTAWSGKSDSATEAFTYTNAQKFYDDLKTQLDYKSFYELMDVDIDGDMLTFAVQERDGVIIEFAMLSRGKGKVTLVYIVGELTFNDLANIANKTSKMDIQRMKKHLKKIKK